jgi:chromosomal replication initiator protein
MQDVVKDDSDRLSGVSDALRRRLGADRFDLWLGGRTRLEFVGNTLRVVCASRAELLFLRRNLHRPLAECCVATCSPAPTVVFHEAAPGANGDEPVAATRTMASIAMSSVPAAAISPTPLRVAAATRPTAEAPTPRTNVRTFETFACGSSNRLALQAARDLAEHPGRFSPLLLSGPVGCGKSHLVEAIEHAARRARGRVRSVAITSEQFTTEFLEALHRRAVPGFRHKMRGIDLLLVDDVHFFVGKRATIEELNYTIDTLQARGGQVVLTSECSVADLAAFSPELAARIGGGLAVAIDPPDFAVRLGVVRHIAERVKAALCDAVIELVARQVVGSARLLAGAINRLVATSMASSQAITLEFAERVIADFCQQHAPQVRLPDIQRAVCDLFGVEPATLRSQRRTRAVAEPRMLCMWLARRYTRAALSEIGEFFGGRSHSTVVSAKRKFDEMINEGGEVVIGDRPCRIDEAIRRIEARLRTG